MMMTIQYNRTIQFCKLYHANLVCLRLLKLLIHHQINRSTSAVIMFIFSSFKGVMIFGMLLSSNDALSPKEVSSARRNFLFSLPATAWVATNLPTSSPAMAEDVNLTNERIKEIVRNDLLERQFLVTGNLTPSIYRSTATFTDEIDTYKMDQWMKGTQKLFNANKSSVRLVGDVSVNKDKVEFLFDEDLCFRIPFEPVVHLTGKVVLDRDEAGYITSYREYWDQDVISVLKTAKF